MSGGAAAWGASPWTFADLGAARRLLCRAGMKRLAVVALPLALFAAACDPHDEDQVRAVAVSDRTVVVGANTTTVGGFGCGGLDEGRPAYLVSSDGGASFDRLEPEDGLPITALAARGGTLFALRGSDGFTVEASTDGVAWTAVAGGTGFATDLTVDDAGLQVAYSGGVITSADGVTWVDHPIDGGGLYAPHLTRVGGVFVLATGDGVVRTSVDGDTWSPRAIESLASVHRVAAAGGRAVAIAHADRAGTYGAFAVAFAPDGDAPATFAAIPENTMAIVDAPAGILLGDGTLAAGGDLTRRTAHTAGFAAGAVDGAQVVLVTGDRLAISTDGGATFSARDLPLLR